MMSTTRHSTGARQILTHVLAGDKQVWTQQLTEASAYAGKEGLFVQDVQTQVITQGELRQETAIVFGRRDLLAILKAGGI